MRTFTAKFLPSKDMNILWLVIYLALACALQLATGNIDVGLFSFPVGIAVGIALVAVLYVVDSEWGRLTWMRQLRSPQMSRRLIAFTAAACVIGGCMSAEASFQTSVPFVALLIALMANLTLVIIHRLHSHRVKSDLVFLSTHIGLWLALFGGLAGAGDNQQLRTIVSQDKATSTAFTPQGRMVSLPYTLRLKDFHIETNAADGSPTQYRATVLVNDTPAEIAVNSPHAVSLSEDLYLMSFNAQHNASWCILMVERQPWKYVMLTGICLLLAGTLFSINNL